MRIWIVLILWGAISCAPPAEEELPSKETVEGRLREEGESLKKEGEAIDPSLGVKITWNVEEVLVQEQVGVKNEPWIGTIRFHIVSVTPEYDGSNITQEFTREFDYIWDLANDRWLMK